jgi:hypothetical protein
MQSLSKPTDEQVDAAIVNLASPQHEWYFFERLNNPFWIEPLAKRGFFKYPPAAELLSDGNVQSSPWPESRFLVRMAAQSPQEVAAIFSQLQTDNLLVIHDLQKAALEMPPENGVKLTSAICRGLKDGLADFKDAADLCEKFAIGSQGKMALKLAESLFAVRFANGVEDPPNRVAHWYFEALRKLAPILMPIAPIDFLKKLCIWLRAAVEGKRPRREFGDFSTIWRPAIEEHDQNNAYDFASRLVSIVRSSFELAISNDRISLDDALKILDKERLLIFKRLAIHLIGSFADGRESLARQKIMDRSLFEDSDYKHEYAMLVGQRFPILSESERRAWFEWVKEARVMSEANDHIKRLTGKGPTDEEREQSKRYWQYERFHWVRKHLDENQTAFYAEMFAKYGPPLLADLNSRHGSRVGDTTPIPLDQLQKLPLPEAVTRIAQWRPTHTGFWGFEREGLIGTFRAYIGANPAAFSKDALDLRQGPYILVHTYLDEMSKAILEGKEIEVAAVLDLCGWILDQPVVAKKPSYNDSGNAAEIYQQWTRDAVSRFVETICKARTNGLPRYSVEELRSCLGNLLKRLMEEPTDSSIIDQEPTPDLRVLDYLDHAINSSRGKAIEALFEFAQWIADDARGEDKNQESEPGEFGSMPEVMSMLDLQVQQPSFPSAALFGAKIGNLYWMNKAWLESNVEKIFNLREFEISPKTACGWVAWNAFLIWAVPHIEFYRLLRAQFAYAVTQLPDIPPSNRPHREPISRLGEHLIVLYGRGQLSLDDDGGLLRRFFRNSSRGARIHVMEFIGDSLTSEAPLGPEVIGRFQQLWDFYWGEFGPKDFTSGTRSRIGSWFESNEFPNEWYLSRLENVINTATFVDLDRAVVERLAEIAPTAIERTTVLLDRLLPSAEGGWRLWDWSEPSKRILQLGLQADQPVRDQARRIIDRLGRRGLTEFGDLLKS